MKKTFKITKEKIKCANIIGLINQSIDQLIDRLSI